MKYLIPAFVFAVLFYQTSRAQVVVEDSFKFGASRATDHYDGEAQRATPSLDWPVDISDLNVTEVKFAKKTMTKWHRQKGDKYMITTDGQGQIQYYNTGGQLITNKITKNGRVYVPSSVCHRHGSDGKAFAQVLITTGTTQWDECHEEFAPQEKPE